MRTVFQFPRTVVLDRAAWVAHDRAAATATAILQTVRGAMLAWLDRDDTAMATVHTEIETILRTEFADIARTTLNETRREDG